MFREEQAVCRWRIKLMPCCEAWIHRCAPTTQACLHDIRGFEVRRAHNSVKVVPKMPMRLSTRKWRNVGTAASKRTLSATRDTKPQRLSLTGRCECILCCAARQSGNRTIKQRQQRAQAGRRRPHRS